MIRKRIKLNRIKNKRERLKYARQLVIEKNNKLSKGWNPFIEQEAPKSFSFINEAIDFFFVNQRLEPHEQGERIEQGERQEQGNVVSSFPLRACFTFGIFFLFLQ